MLACNGNKGDSERRDAEVKAKSDTIITTLAAIRSTAGGIELLFNDRASIYKLKGDDTTQFTAGNKAGEPLKIVADSLHNILAVLSVSTEELKFISANISDTIRSIMPMAIDVNKIDTTVFNIIDRNPDFRKWRLACINAIPDMATAQSVFDFCAAQSCNLPGPFAINPCIPFQYVVDGCYARAHKMRWILENRYNYCNYKVFSFANQNNDVLAVKANKWGGCCVSWWYHVAPLVYIKQGSTNVAYVIDPGMFNSPVTLSTWLQAQATTSCNGRARVSTYSIQPSSAYTPANYAGTSFTTDPNYTATNNTLILYRNGVTCP